MYIYIHTISYPKSPMDMSPGWGPVQNCTVHSAQGAWCCWHLNIGCATQLRFMKVSINTPIGGWFIMEKRFYQQGWFGGTPPILWNPNMVKGGKGGMYSTLYFEDEFGRFSQNLELVLGTPMMFPYWYTVGISSICNKLYIVDTPPKIHADRNQAFSEQEYCRTWFPNIPKLIFGGSMLLVSRAGSCKMLQV